MKIPNSIRVECREIRPFACLIGGICGLILSIISSLLAGNFFILYRFLLLPRSVFPPIIFLMFQSLQFILVGVIIGIILTTRRPRDRKWRNCALLLHITYLMLLAIWFPLVFGSVSFLMALAAAIVAAVLCFYSLRFTARVSAIATIAAFVHFLWLTYIVWMSFAIVILN
ncbi:MAG: tryptophan-rich sensory protein [Oscillospiraceae bacterium]|nr:tryptophan-rich sensory protein [Oscillospiraceae bacterium]